MTDSTLDLQVTKEDNKNGSSVIVAKINGFLNGANSKQIENLAAQTIKNEKKSLILHFDNIEFKDPGVLPSLLVRAADMTKHGDCYLRLIGLPGATKSFLQTIDMLQFFSLYETIEQALEDEALANEVLEGEAVQDEE